LELWKSALTWHAGAGVACNVSDPTAVEHLVRTATAVMGGMDVVINNAGYSGSFQVGAAMQTFCPGKAGCRFTPRRLD
jgi:NAD(P)-dependent dehydrogenase (short-subunit alcohol dehydrogenase family)